MEGYYFEHNNVIYRQDHYKSLKDSYTVVFPQHLLMFWFPGFTIMTLIFKDQDEVTEIYFYI